jgi:hypothetical protein
MLVSKAAAIRTRAIDRPEAQCPRQDRRKEGRHVALLRVGVLHARGHKDLCVVKNISANGLSARAYRQVAVGDEVHIEFKSGEILTGKIAWTQNWNIGMAFPDPIDFEAVLASRWVTEGQRRRNLPRVPVICDGRLKHGARSMDVTLLDISQGGARLRIGGFPADLGEAVLTLPDLAQIGGVLRWIANQQAGMSFNECLSFDQLASWIHAKRD